MSIWETIIYGALMGFGVALVCTKLPLLWSLGC
jgi:hypothetical protein